MGARIAIVEDHGLLANTVATALASSGMSVEVISIPDDGDLSPVVDGASFDLVLLDLDLGRWGDATPKIAPLSSSGVRVLMVTGVRDPVRHARCIEAGAVGIVGKSSGFDTLLTSITTVLDAGSLLSAHDRQDHLAILREHDRARAEQLAPFDALSPREAEVLGELMTGRTVDEIASTSFVTVATVRTQVRLIREKLGVTSQVGAIGRAREATWIPPQER